MLIGVVAFAIYGFITRPETSHTVLRANAEGKLEKVDRQLIDTPKPPALWKPEPQHLLTQDGLGLSDAQRGQIAKIASNWRARKNELDAQIEAAVSKARPNGQVSAVVLEEGLSEYSTLSRMYDLEREGHWQEACSLLSSKQRAVLGGGR